MVSALRVKPLLKEAILRKGMGTEFRLGVAAVEMDEFFPFGRQVFFFEDMIRSFPAFPFGVFFFSPLDWAENRDQIPGYVFDGKWRKTISPLPELIYDRAFAAQPEDKDRIEIFRHYLETKNIPVLNPPPLARLLNDKTAFHRFLWKNNVPTLPFFKPEKILESKAGEEASVYYLKPIFGSKGAGIWLIRLLSDGFELILAETRLSKVFDSAGSLWKYLLTQLDPSQYFLQPEAKTSLFEGSPFDIRVLVQDAGKGHDITGMGVRIGAPSSWTANLNTGGRAIPFGELAPFIHMRLGRDPVAEEEKIREICLDCCSLIKAELGSFLEIGFDILLTGEGPLILEGNAKPSRWVFQSIGDHLERAGKDPAPYRALRRRSVRIPLEYGSFLLHNSAPE
jgi:hypothetical protein